MQENLREFQQMCKGEQSQREDEQQSRCSKDLIDQYKNKFDALKKLVDANSYFEQQENQESHIIRRLPQQDPYALKESNNFESKQQEIAAKLQQLQQKLDIPVAEAKPHIQQQDAHKYSSHQPSRRTSFLQEPIQQQQQQTYIAVEQKTKTHNRCGSMMDVNNKPQFQLRTPHPENSKPSFISGQTQQNSYASNKLTSAFQEDLQRPKYQSSIGFLNNSNHKSSVHEDKTIKTLVQVDQDAKKTAKRKEEFQNFIGKIGLGSEASCQVKNGSQQSAREIGKAQSHSKVTAKLSEQSLANFTLKLQHEKKINVVPRY